MKVLYFTKYSRLAASSRMRSFQYFPGLKKAGLEIDVKPLFGDDYLQARYMKKSLKLIIFKSFLNRFFQLFSIYKYQRIVIEKELFPYFPSLFEWIFNLLGVQYIVDYDDAIFHNYDLHPKLVVRLILGKKIDKVMRYSRLVTAGNSYLAARATSAGAKNVCIIPTVVDLNRYQTKVHQDRLPVIIGWIGTMTTFEKHFSGIKNIIKAVLDKYNVVFHVIGVEQDLGFGKKVKYFPWSEESEVAQILEFDIGIMPLRDTPSEYGKCAYKLIQYMATGLPVIASPIGMNTEVVFNGQNGYLAGTEEEWLRAIGLYIDNPQLRTQHGLNGLAIVNSKYCLDVTGKSLIKILK